MKFSTNKRLKEKVFFKDKNSFLFIGDSLEILKLLPDNSVSLIITDPPYFLSNNGITCQSGKMVSVNKGSWDKKTSLNEINEFNLMWLKESKRILEPNGSIWVSGTSHNIFSVGYIMRELEYKILNNVTWVKKSPPPNLSCRFFTHSTETIIWGKKNEKSKHTFNYHVMKELNGGKQMKDVWEIGRPKKDEKKFGKHPTQKPEEVMERLVLSTSNPGDIVLDMFCGSGTTGVVSIKHNRKFIGIDENVDFLEISKKRILDVKR
jgi:site-specific DNA-methyltransferase (adenine-specific)